MSPISPDQLDRAEAIITDICGDKGGLCLYQEDGTYVWQAPQCNIESLSLVREIALKDEQEQVIARVKIYWKGAADPHKIAALEKLTETWSQECALARELDEMANELADRYEELNLLYKTSKKNSSQNNDEDPIATLLGECVSKLDLDYAIAVQRDFGMLYIHHRAGSSPQYNEREYASMLREASDKYTGTQAPAVINADDNTTEPSPIQGYHAVFTPLQPSPSNSLGGLWFFRKADGEKFYNSDSRIARSIASEITARLLEHHDSTTGLLNRSGFEKSLQTLIDLGTKAKPSIIAYINIQRFSIVNDHGGYAAGDELLKHLSRLLSDYFRETDTVARLVADEFIVLLKDCSSEQAITRLEGLLASVAKHPFSWKEQSFPISLAVGLTPLNAHSSANVCIKEAGATCDLATQMGANQIRVFDGKDLQYQRYTSERQMIPLLHTALAENLFELYAQPIFTIHSDRTELSHAEILVRLRDKNGEMISPSIFVPAAERFGLMPDIDMWIVKHTIAVFSQWQQDNPGTKTKLSINLSGRTLTTDYASELLRLISESSITAEQICFEITETAALIDMDTAINFITRLRRQGCSFALDDFGSGLSSFSYLQNLPVDYLKIDGSFVKDIAKNPLSRTFVDGINNIGHAMGLKTIAEFVADEDILRVLAELNVDYAQGFHCAEPAPIAEYFSLLSTAHSPPKRSE